MIVKKDGSMTNTQMINVLNVCYDKALSGVPLVSESVSELAEEYMKKHLDTNVAVDKLVKNQIMKCGTSGFLTGLGGLITLPIAIPANLSSVIYVQLRMIACIAYMGGYKPSDDEVRTLAYVCLTGTACADILKRSGIVIGEKITTNLIKKIPGTVLIRINQRVGFRMLTKFGTKGAINIGKMVPVVGGVIGGGFDVASTRIIAKNAKKVFIEGIL